MSANGISRRSFVVLAVFVGMLTLFAVLSLAGGILQLTSSMSNGWVMKTLSCGCTMLAPTAATTHIVPWAMIGFSGLFAGWLAFSVARVSVRVRGEWQRRRAGKLPANDRLSDLAARLGITRVFLSRTEPDASTIGLWRPEIFVSDRLVRRLPTGELMAVLAHEAAHQAHHDSARLFWVAVFEQSFGMLPAVKRLVSQFRQGIEQAADQVSVARLGGAFPLSRALTRMLGWRLTVPSTTVASFAPAPDRLEALLRPVHQGHAQFFMPQLLAIVILPLLAFVLLMRPAGAAPSAAPSSTMCHAPAVCRFINSSSATTQQSHASLHCAAEPTSTCLTQ